MSVTSIEKHAVGSSGHIDAKQVDFTVKYRAYVSSALDGAKVILQYLYDNRPTTPWIGAEYEYANDSLTTAFCYSINVPSRVAGSTDVWEFDVHYKTPDNSGDSSTDSDGNLTTNPLDFRADISFGYTHFREPCIRGIYRGGFTHDLGVNGCPRVLADGDEVDITNSAWEPYDPPAERDGQYGVWRIKSNHLTYDSSSADDIINTVNAHKLAVNPWLQATGTIERYCGKIMSVEGTPRRATVLASTIDYYEVLVEIHINKKTWREEIIDRGFHRGAWAGAPNGRGGTISAVDLPVGVPELAPIQDFDGLPVLKPVLLNGAGFPKAASDANVYAGRWQKYDENGWIGNPYINSALMLF